MKLMIIFGLVAGFVCVLLLLARKKARVQAEVDTAVARREFQFIALMAEDGKIQYPQVPEIPAWYFQTTGIRIKTITDATREQEMAYMNNYNETLCHTLKAQGKFQALLDNVASLKTNLAKLPK